MSGHTLPSEPIQLLVVEDDHIFRQGLRAVLAEFSARVVIAGEVADAESAVHWVRDHAPDLALIDLRIQVRRGLNRQTDWQNGVHAIEQIAQISPRTRILVLSYLDEPDVLMAALEAGAHGYISKGDGYAGAQISDALMRVADGEVILGPAVAARLPGYALVHTGRATLKERLTAREREVLELVASRCTNPQIADRLHITVRTVKSHVANILEKLHLESRYQLVKPYRPRGAEEREIGD